MRVLMASSWLPKAPITNWRFYELVKRLASHCEVTVFGGVLQGDTSQVDELRDLGVRIISIPWNDEWAEANRTRGAWAGRWSTFYSSFVARKSGRLKWLDRCLADGPAELRELLRTQSFDIVHLDNAMVHWINASELACPLVIEFPDINHRLVQREAALRQHARHRLFGIVASKKILRYERQAAVQGDLCVTTSEVDSRFLRMAAAGIRTVEIPNGVDVEYYRPQGRVEGDDNVLLFHGSLGYQPNIDAARHFVHRILPSIHDRRPDVRLLIVGAAPPPEVLELGACPGVTVLADVPDMRPYIAQAGVIVVPLRIGSGTRRKILDALAMGKAVVSTTLGAEGLDLGPNEIVRADAPKQMANAISELLDNPVARTTLGSQGRERATSLYSWDISTTKLVRAYEGLLKGS
ncbi:MAG: uncharacterized protein JWO59_2144 [Chloroflexi bacterium]|nr:uncharacterized protein [Chloroflexota bacterium]